jgi:hypothetical protein
MAPAARLAELAALLARAYLRACVRATARVVGTSVQSGPQGAVARSRNPLALSAESEPSCTPTPTARNTRDAAAPGGHDR